MAIVRLYCSTTNKRAFPNETLHLKGLLSREKLAVENGGTVYLLLQVTAPEQWKEFCRVT